MYPLPRVNGCTAIKSCFKNYINCSGRARRSEYWLFIAFITSIGYFLEIFLVLFASGTLWYHKEYDYERERYIHKSNKGAVIISAILFGVFVLGTLLPALTATVRRLHDVGMGGGFIFIFFLPGIGFIILLVFLCLDSMKETNMYGPSPKYTQIITNAIYTYSQTPVQNYQNYQNYEYPSYNEMNTPNDNVNINTPMPINNSTDNNFSDNIITNEGAPPSMNGFDSNTYY